MSCKFKQYSLGVKMAWAVVTKCNVAIWSPTTLGWGKSWVLPLTPGNPGLVTRLVWLWGCHQPNTSRRCVWLRVAGCEGLHLLLGNAPPVGVPWRISWHQSEVPSKCISPKAKFDKSLLRVFEIQTKSSCSMQRSGICANRHPALQYVLLYFQTEAPYCNTSREILVQLQFRDSREWAAASRCPDMISGVSHSMFN